MMNAAPDTALERIAHLSPAQRRQLLGELLRRRLQQPHRFPLSSAQERVWLFERLHPDTAVYNIPLLMRLPGSLDIEALTRSFNEILRRHEVLQATFTEMDGLPIQEIRAAQRQSIPLADLSALPAEQRSADAGRIVQEDAVRPFDLVNGPLIRTRLIRLADDDHWLVIIMHHLVSDGWSLGILMKELAALYAAFAHGLASPLGDLRFQFFDYVAWQRGWLSGDNLRRLETYWKRQLAGAPPVLELPTDRPRPAHQTFSGALHEFTLAANVAGAIVQRAQAERVTLFVFLLAAYATLLYRYTGQDDMVIGVPMAGRVRTEFEPLIGFFVNNLALRLDLHGNPTFAELTHRVNDAVLDAHEHQAYPFERLVDLIGANRHHDRAPVYQVVFNLQNNPTWGSFALDDPRTAAMPQAHSGTAKWDLNLTMIGGASGMFASIEYNNDLFVGDSIARMADRFLRILAAVQQDMAIALLAIPLDGETGTLTPPAEADHADDFDFGS
jgi:non-ribosomal peptide synthetase component F